MNERDLGEVQGTVRALEGRLASIDGRLNALDAAITLGFQRMQDKSEVQHQDNVKRLSSLERSRAWGLGILAILGILWTVALLVIAAKLGTWIHS